MAVDKTVGSGADRSDAGLPEAGLTAGTGWPRSDDGDRGSLGKTGDRRGSAGLTDVDTGRAEKRSDRQGRYSKDDDIDGQWEPCSSKKRSQRRDRERGFQVEADDNSEEDERATSSATGRQPNNANRKTTLVASDSGMSRNVKSYAVGTKLGSYDGTTSLETFLARLENCAEYFDWTDADRLYHL